MWQLEDNEQLYYTHKNANKSMHLIKHYSQISYMVLLFLLFSSMMPRYDRIINFSLSSYFSMNNESFMTGPSQFSLLQTFESSFIG